MKTNTLKNENDGPYIKWFYRAQNTKKTFLLSYTVTNAATRGQDIDEVYWQMVGSEWDIPELQVLVNFHLPDGIDGQAIQAWAHGAEGRVTIVSSSLVHYNAPSVVPGKFFEARILLPSGTFTGGAVGTLTRQDILDQENEFIARTIRENRSSSLVLILLLAVVVATILVNIVFTLSQIVLFFKHGKDSREPKVNLSGTLWEPPSDIDPAQVEQLMNGTKSLSPKSFVATLLSLVKEKRFSIGRSDEKQGFLIKKYRYFLVLNPHESGLELSSIQSHLDYLLTRSVGAKTISLQGSEKEVITFERIKQFFKSHPTYIQEFQKTFEEKALKENLAEGYFDQESHRLYTNHKPFLVPVLTWVVLFAVRVLMGRASMLSPWQDYLNSLMFATAP